MKIVINGEDIILHPSGIAIMARARLAIVSDLHLEKGSHFARRGFFLPPYDSDETLLRLIAVLGEENISRLLILGDCFHDDKGYHRLQPRARALFASLLSFNPIWIRGNHDGDFVPPGFTAHDEYAEGGVVFRHINNGEDISGHYHPKAEIEHKGGYVMRPCFVEDGKRLILPAFGAYTGGLSLSSPVIRNLFPGAFRFHTTGRKIYSFDALE